jgi:hypothetical protein
VVIASSEITTWSWRPVSRHVPGADVELWRLEYRLSPRTWPRWRHRRPGDDGQGGITEYTQGGLSGLSTAPRSYTYLDVLWSTEFTGDAADLQRRVTELAYGVRTGVRPDRQGRTGWYGLGGPDVGFLEGEPVVEPWTTT